MILSLSLYRHLGRSAVSDGDEWLITEKMWLMMVIHGD